MKFRQPADDWLGSCRSSGGGLRNSESVVQLQGSTDHLACRPAQTLAQRCGVRGAANASDDNQSSAPQEHMSNRSFAAPPAPDLGHDANEQSTTRSLNLSIQAK